MAYSEYIYILGEEDRGSKEKYYTYKFPKKYERHSDLILELVASYLYWNKSLLINTEENIEWNIAIAARNLSDCLTPNWIMYRAGYGQSYKFFLLNKDMIFNYFIKGWEASNCTSWHSSVNIIKRDYNSLCAKAVIERDEKIIRSII